MSLRQFDKLLNSKATENIISFLMGLMVHEQLKITERIRRH